MVTRFCSFIVLTASLMLASCDSVFDSYYPTQLEYLTTQTDVSGILGGKSLVSAELRYLPATNYQANLLVMHATSSDGESYIVFYDPSSLSILKSYKNEDFAAINGGNVPPLPLIAQDEGSYSTPTILGGLFTGTVQYDPGTLVPLTVLSSLPGAIGSTGNLSSFKECFSPSGAVLFGPNGNTLGEFSQAQYSSISSLSPITGLSFNNPSVLDAAYVNGQIGLLISDQESLHLMTFDLSTSSVTDTPLSISGFRVESGWVSVPAAVAVVQANDTYNLTSYSWKGDVLGTLKIQKTNNEIFAFAAEPAGKSWYMLDSATGKLSRNRPWW